MRLFHLLALTGIAVPAACGDIVAEIWPSIRRDVAEKSMEAYVRLTDHVLSHSKGCNEESAVMIADAIFLGQMILNVVQLARGTWSLQDVPESKISDVGRQVAQSSGHDGFARLPVDELQALQERYFGILDADQEKLVNDVFKSVQDSWKQVTWVCRAETRSTCPHGLWAFVPRLDAKREVYICPKYVKGGISFHRRIEEKDPAWHPIDKDSRSMVLVHEMMHLVTKPNVPENNLPIHIPDQPISVLREVLEGDRCHGGNNESDWHCKVYGRQRTQELGKVNGHVGLRNADNYVFYAHDLVLGATYGMAALDEPSKRLNLSLHDKDRDPNAENGKARSKDARARSKQTDRLMAEEVLRRLNLRRGSMHGKDEL